MVTSETGSQNNTVVPFLNTEFRNPSLDVGSLLDRRRFEANLRRYDVARKSETSTDFSKAWPIGAMFFSIDNINPSIKLGFGTWVQIANGQFIVGQGPGDADFSEGEKTGGQKTIDIAHEHGVSGNSGWAGTHDHTINPPNTTTSGPTGLQNTTGGGTNVASLSHTHTVDIAAFDSESTGSHRHPIDLTSDSAGSATQSIVPPYFTAYVWKRVA